MSNRVGGRGLDFREAEAEREGKRQRISETEEVVGNVKCGCNKTSIILCSHALKQPQCCMSVCMCTCLRLCVCVSLTC